MLDCISTTAWPGVKAKSGGCEKFVEICTDWIVVNVKLDSRHFPQEKLVAWPRCIGGQYVGKCVKKA